MTAPRTIPENPKPGERYAERLAAGWFVKRLDRIDGDDRFFTSIAGPLSEADARLLVYGEELIQVVDYILPCAGSKEESIGDKAIRAVLANLEGKS